MNIIVGIGIGIIVTVAVLIVLFFWAINKYDPLNEDEDEDFPYNGVITSEDKKK